MEEKLNQTPYEISLWEDERKLFSGDKELWWIKNSLGNYEKIEVDKNSVLFPSIKQQTLSNVVASVKKIDDFEEQEEEGEKGTLQQYYKINITDKKSQDNSRSIKMTFDDFNTTESVLKSKKLVSNKEEPYMGLFYLKNVHYENTMVKLDFKSNTDKITFIDYLLKPTDRTVVSGSVYKGLTEQEKEKIKAKSTYITIYMPLKEFQGLKNKNSQYCAILAIDMGNTRKYKIIYNKTSKYFQKREFLNLYAEIRKRKKETNIGSIYHQNGLTLSTRTYFLDELIKPAFGTVKSLYSFDPETAFRIKPFFWEQQGLEDLTSDKDWKKNSIFYYKKPTGNTEDNDYLKILKHFLPCVTLGFPSKNHVKNIFSNEWITSLGSLKMEKIPISGNQRIGKNDDEEYAELQTIFETQELSSSPFDVTFTDAEFDTLKNKIISHNGGKFTLDNTTDPNRPVYNYSKSSNNYSYRFIKNYVWTNYWTFQEKVANDPNATWRFSSLGELKVITGYNQAINPLLITVPLFFVNDGSSSINSSFDWGLGFPTTKNLKENKPTLKIEIPQDSSLKFDLYIGGIEYFKGIKCNSETELEPSYSNEHYSIFNYDKVSQLTIKNLEEKCQSNQFFSYFDEKKKSIIGQNNSQNKRYAMNPSLNSSINGTSTLTFSMYKKYWDDDVQDFVENPFPKMLLNESKIKLNKNGKWYDFLIKNIEEESNEKILSYTCKDLSASLLSKQGFSTEFSSELYNNQGTIKELTDYALAESGWEQGDTEIVLEKQEETLYKVQLLALASGDGLLANRDFFNEKGEKIGRIGTYYENYPELKDTVQSAVTVYMHYSDLNKKWEENDLIPCYLDLQRDEKEYATVGGIGWNNICLNISNLEVNDNNVIDDWDKVVYFKYMKRRDSTILTDEIAGTNKHNGYGSFGTKQVSKYRSKKVKDTDVSIYFPKLKKFAQIYTKEGEETQYCCFSNAEYITKDMIKELAINGGSENESEGILSDNGWYTNSYEDVKLSYDSIIENSDDSKFEELIKTNTGEINSNNIKGYISIKKQSTGQNFLVYNTGFKENFKEAITQGDRFIIEADIYYSRGLQYLQAAICETKTLASGVEWIGKTTSDVGITIGEFYIPGAFDGGTTTTSKKRTILRRIDCFNDDGKSETELRADTGDTRGTIVFEILSNTSLTEEEIKEKSFAVCIWDQALETGEQIEQNTAMHIGKLSVYKKLTDDNNYVIAPDFTIRSQIDSIQENETRPTNITTTAYWFRNADYNNYMINSKSNIIETAGLENNYPVLSTKTKYSLSNNTLDDIKDFDNMDKLVYLKEEYSPPEEWGLGYVKKTTKEKIRNIEISKSNTFNILQTLSETFGVWCKLTIEHEEDGRIKLSNPPYYKKQFVSFHNFIGRKNDWGLSYKDDQKTQRTLNSDAIVTKLIVPDNITSVAEDGFCSIAKAIDNPYKDREIYNLEYYIQMGILTEDARKDLNDFAAELSTKAITNFDNIKIQTEYAAIKNSTKADKEVWENLVIETEKKLLELKEDFLFVYEASVEDLLASSNWKTDPNLNLSNIFVGGKDGPKTEFIDGFKTDLTTILVTATKLGNYDENEESSDYSTSTGYYKSRYDSRMLYNQAVSNYDSITSTINNLNDTISTIKKNFTKRYGTYIQEGTWSSSNYLDNNLYYLDAIQTLALSAKPQVEYSISVTDVNQKYSIGDRTTIEDPEFFGWVLKSTVIDGKNSYIQTPYKERVVISELVEKLDNPSENSIIVKNYRTQFEDLFQRMAAETQNIQYKEGAYDNAAAAVDHNGQILPDAITNTFNNTSFIISHAQEQGLTWDNQGITATDQTNKNLKVNIKGGIIRVSNDGGLSWQVSINGTGINANAITTGTLNTSLVNITTGNNKNVFKWSDQGIVATLFDMGDYDFNSTITFNQYGLFGGLSDGTNLSDTFMQQLTNIHKTSRFALTWKGFSLKTGHANSTGYVSIDSDDDITLNVKPTGSSDYLKIIQIGHLESTASTSASDAGESAEPTSQSSESGHYGIRVKDMTGNVILETTEEHVNGRFHINCGEWI